MRNFTIWVLSALLGIQPALSAQGQAEQLAEMKKLIEQSQIAQKPLKLKEIFSQIPSETGGASKAEFKKFLAQYGNYKIPKMDASKVKGPNGKEYYRLQTVKGGQSITVDIVDDGTTFARVNGKSLTYADLATIQSALLAMGVPPEEVDEHFPRKPASSSPFLEFNQFQQLKVEEQKKYLKQIRQMMESMEAVDYSLEPQKTSSTFGGNSFSVIALWLRGVPAFAAGTCVAAGNVISKASSSSLGCGIDSKGNVPVSLRSFYGSLVCAPNEILCNPVVYPNDRGICVPHGRESTQRCNEKVTDREFMEAASKNPKYNTAEKFQNFKRAVEKKAQSIMDICASSLSSSESSGFSGALFGDVPKSSSPAPKKGSKKVVKVKRPPTSDQKYHCERFKERYDEIKNWCNDPEIRSRYPKLCVGAVAPVSDAKPTPVPLPLPAQHQSPSPVGSCPAGQVCCDQLPLGMDRSQGSCDASGGAVSTGQCYNVSTRTQENVYVCTCPGGLSSKMKCSRPVADDNGQESRNSRKSAKKEGPNWLLVTGILGGLMFLGYHAYRSAQKKWYENLEPQPQNPPIPPPVAPPSPQPGPPAPRTGGAV